MWLAGIHSCGDNNGYESIAFWWSTWGLRNGAEILSSQRFLKKRETLTKFARFLIGRAGCMLYAACCMLYVVGTFFYQIYLEECA